MIEFNCLGETKEAKCITLLNSPCCLEKTLRQAVILIGLPILIGVGTIFGARFSSLKSYRIALGVAGSLALLSPILAIGGFQLLKRAEAKEKIKPSGEDDALVVGQSPASVHRFYQDGKAGLCGVIAVIFLGTLITGALAWNSLGNASKGVRAIQKISTVTSGIAFIGALAIGFFAKQKSEQQAFLPETSLSKAFICCQLYFPRGDE